MWRSKKLIIVAVLAAVIMAGGIGGVVLAADNEDDSQPEARCGALLERVCEIYEEKTGVAIDAQELEGAFIQARSEMQTQALQNRFQNLVDEGKITQQQADDYQNWQKAKPDIPSGFGSRGHGGVSGHGGMRGFGGPCAPAN